MSSSTLLSLAPISILHVCPRPSFSGLEAYALAMAQGQKNLGHRVEFVVLQNSPLAQRCEKEQIPTLSIRAGTSGWMDLIRQVSRRLSRTDRPSVIHLHSTQDLDPLLIPLLISRVAKGSRTKVVLQTHIWISHSKRDPLHALSYSLIDEVWCSSQPARETLEKFLPIAKNKIRIVNYGREIEKIEKGFLSREEARIALDLPLDATVVGTVARIDEGKGTRELLEGSLQVMETHPKLHLLLIGPPTADDPKAVAFGHEILTRIEGLPQSLKERVHAPGAVPDSYRFLKAFDLFALATYKECFALSLLEAQLAQLPCLATNSGGSPEIVREGQTGWLFAPRSTNALRDALVRALNERDLWSLYGQRAQERVRREYDFTKILPEIVAMYQRLIEPNRA